ncbi:hypothetical protein HN681_03980 [archaeon]|jgi:hypothetical protein|nr:hypothetical protein [archaeon]MBT4669580.1 hypothetical protein [archaeon]MBT5030337.1 hypothetical protein [archaeon]MBT5288370.1 hypothetical protein [archaeon]MBT7052516.1 hypothetical protein [archaeon]
MKIEDLLDLPIKYKKTTTLLLAGLYTTYTFLNEINPNLEEFSKFGLDPSSYISSSSTKLILETLGISFCTNLTLQALAFIKKPRLINLLATLTTGSALTTRHMFNPSPESLESLIEFAEERLNPPNPHSIEEDKAKLHLMKGELGLGILQYSKYLETQKEKISDQSIFIKFISAPLLKRLYQIRSKKNITSQFEYIYACLEAGDESTPFEKIWPRIINNNPSLEIKLAHALSLSKSSRTEEAQNAWQEIIENQKENLHRIGQSRNEVLEIIASEELRGTVIIKRGNNLGKESYVLSEAYKSTSVNKLYTPALVTYYTKDKEILITFRRAAENLDSRINEENTKATMISLARLHSLKLKLPEYNPLSELNRRLIERLGNFEEAKPLLYEFKKLLASQEGEKVTCHCDFYPTNVLDDATIIDLETAALHYPSLDIENFRTHPNAPQDESSIKKYLEHRSEIEGRKIDLRNRHIYRVLCPTFQIGSFFAKDDKENFLGFIETTLESIKETGLTQLRDPLMYYLNSTPIKALL